MSTRTTSVWGTRLPTLRLLAVAQEASSSLMSADKSTVKRSVRSTTTGTGVSSADGTGAGKESVPDPAVMPNSGVVPAHFWR
jgi:hypothetical protein